MPPPVLFLIFNRPELTFKVFEVIRKAKPEKLFIAADGPREDKAGEAEKCAETRKVIEQIDWDCEVKTLFRKKNLGCGKAVSEAITWFFENVEEGIILEDDCLPRQSFFTYCEELLEKYRDNKNIMHIGGTNYLENRNEKTSYYFSRYVHIWGWATWKRAWNLYSYKMEGFEDFKDKKNLYDIFKNTTIADYHLNKLQKTFDGEIDTWDYQWSYAVWKNNGLCIIPTNNLIVNIGFDKEATHTKESNNLSNKISSELKQLIHPKTIKEDTKADNEFFWKLAGYKNQNVYLLNKRKRKITEFIYNLYKKIK